MGLFDFGGFGGGDAGQGFAGGEFGGGFDMDKLLQMINPIAPAQAAPLPPPTTDLMNPNNVTMDALKLRNSPAAAEGIAEQAARQKLGDMIRPDVGNPSPTPTMPGVPTPTTTRPQIATERGQPTNVTLGDVDERGRPLGPTVAAAAPPPANDLDLQQEAEDKAKLGRSPAVAKPDTDVQESLTGNKAVPDEPKTESVATADTAAKKPEESIQTLAKALRGVQAPAAPVVQRISSPNAPRPLTQIKGGELQALLMALNAGLGGGGPQRTLGK